jgi:hypothetical protein
MAEFFTPPDGFPFVPAEPATPPPDVPGIGHSLLIGSEAAKKDTGWWDFLLQWIVKVVSAVLGFLLARLLNIFAFMIGVIGNITEEASTSYGQIVAATLKELFGVTVNPADVNTRAGGPNRSAVAASLGKAIIGTMFTAAPVQSAGGIQPSSAAADEFLRVVMQLELNGWLESWFVDGVSGHVLEKYGDLKDGITQVLGLGRMSHQAFSPPLKVLVHDPYLALLNQKYRPKQVDVGTAMRAFHRGDTDRNTLSTMLGNQGYTEQEIDWLIKDHAKYISTADVAYMVARGIMTTDKAIAYLQAQGYDASTAGLLLQVEYDHRVQRYRDELVAIATDGYVRGELNDVDLKAAIDNAGMTSTEGSWIGNVAERKRYLHITHLSRGDIEHGIKEGLMTFDDLKKWSTRNNMPIDEETQLELSILFDENKAATAAAAKAKAAKAKADAAAAKQAAATAKAAQAAAQAADKGITLAEAEALVKAGNWSFVQLGGFLTSKGYGADAITGIEALLHEQMAKTAAGAGTAAGVRAAAKAKGLNLAQVEKAVIEGIVTIDDLSSWLAAAGFDTHDASVIVEETQNALDTAKLKAATKAAAAAKAGKHNISLPALERAVRLHITPIDTYTAALQNAAFDQSSIDLLTATLQEQMAADAAAKAAKGAKSGQPAAKVPTLAQIEQEVLAAVRPIDDYRAALTAEGYTAADTDQLVELLQHKIDVSAAAHHLHYDAIGQATKRGIDLTQAENAVMAGINTMANYDAMLKLLGYDDVDRHTLEALLLAKVNGKATAAAGQTPATPPAG